jgi:hypothetical protein
MLERPPFRATSEIECGAERSSSEELSSSDMVASIASLMNELASARDACGSVGAAHRRAAMLESGDAGTLSWDDIEQRFVQRRSQRGA